MILSINPPPTNIIQGNQENTLESTTLYSGLLKQRDVILINPYNKGGGDHALGNKIANIALNDGCRVSILSAYYADIKINQWRHLSLKNNEAHDISHLKDPIFIITPVSILLKDKILHAINQLCNKYHFNKQKKMLVDEMDVPRHQSKLLQSAEILKEMGFEDVKAYNLGFNDGIGYLATDKHQIDAIKQRFESELTRLIDSYNFSLTKDHNYHFGYISSTLAICSAEAFIANTLTETQYDNKDTNYIMVLRLLDGYVANQLSSTLKERLTNSKEGNYDYPTLFAKVTIFVANPHNGKLRKITEFEGTGQRSVNIVVTQSLPKNIFEDFMCLAHSGIASGDQSLNEFISLKGSMPYYDVQPWKQDLAKGLQKFWPENERANMTDHKMLGANMEDRYITSLFLPNKNRPESSLDQLAKKAEIEKKISDSKANDIIREFITPLNEWKEWDKWKEQK